MKTKKIKLNEFKVIPRQNGFLDGLVLKRDLTLRECKYVMKNIFGIVISERDDFDGTEEYSDYNASLCNDVNEWLRGKFDDTIITEYAYDCSDEPLGVFNCISLLVYLQKKNII